MFKNLNTHELLSLTCRKLGGSYLPDNNDLDKQVVKVFTKQFNYGTIIGLYSFSPPAVKTNDMSMVVDVVV